MKIYASYHTEDPALDEMNYQAMKEERMKLYPKCECCGDYIVNDYIYEVDGMRFCSKKCRNKYFMNEKLSCLIRGTGYDDDFYHILDEFTDLESLGDIR